MHSDGPSWGLLVGAVLLLGMGFSCGGLYFGAARETYARGQICTAECGEHWAFDNRTNLCVCLVPASPTAPAVAP